MHPESALYLDLMTLLVFGSVLSLGLIAGLAAALGRSTFRATREARSLRIWLGAVIAQSFFWILFLINGEFHPLVTITLVNTLSVVAMVEYMRAIREFLGRTDRWLLLYSIVGVIVVANVWYGAIAPDYAIRVVSVSLVGALLLLWLTVTLLAHSESALRKSKRITAVVFMFAAASLVLRGGDALLHPDQPFGESLPQQVALLVYALLPVFGSLGFLLMHAERANARLVNQARTDDMTGALNRRAFVHVARHTLAGCQRTGRAMSVMLMDLDRFKQINDTHGHAAGDQALRTFHRRLCSLLRDEDIVARVGGEEFAVLLPGADIENAREVAERVRAGVSESPMVFNGKPIAVRVSIGVAPWDGIERTVEPILARADRAMYAAKRSGRNRVVVAALDDG